MDVGAPTWGRVVGTAAITGVLSYGSFFESITTNGLLAFSWLLVGLSCMLGGYKLLRYWKDEKKANVWVWFSALPIIVFIELMILAHFLHP